MDNTLSLLEKYQVLSKCLNESNLRIWAALEAKSLGRGGITLISKETGISRTTIHAGITELKQMIESKKLPDKTENSRVRAPGGGRKKLTVKDDSLLDDLNMMIDPSTRGDPMSPLRWTSKSTAQIATGLQKLGHKISQRTVCDLLAEMGYSLQSLRKTREGGKHEDRDAQFMHISNKVKEYQASCDPVISVDAKKKELIGDFKNMGSEWQPKGMPEEVRVYDFIDKTLGKVAPYGVYDITANNGWVSVGIDHDTAEFAVESIRRWWMEMGRIAYPNAHRLLITADCGGSNGNRVRLWLSELQKLATELQIVIQICHFPPGTSKWNKIEHRMFCHITANWRGRPLISREIVVNLIGSTTTQQGLHIKATLDENIYQKGIKITDEELAALSIERENFHGEWNYRFLPQSLIK